MLAEEHDLEGDADEKRQKVRAGLRHLHALQAEKMRQDENERQKSADRRILLSALFNVLL